MKIRRMRRFRRRSISRPRKMSVRSLTRKIRLKQAKKPEVKYYDYIATDKPHKISANTGTSTNLWDIQHTLSGLLSSIAQGTGRNQRIGNRIYVKFIKFSMWTTGCPGATTYNVGDFNLRVIVHNTGLTRITAGNTISDFFSPAIAKNINGFINRTNIYVMHDKTYLFRTGWVTGAINPDNLCGASRKLTFNVPFGRLVEYIDGTSTVKNDRDFISLSTIVGCPGMSTATNTTQVACSDISLRIYYTDV